MGVPKKDKVEEVEVKAKDGQEEEKFDSGIGSSQLSIYSIDSESISFSQASVQVSQDVGKSQEETICISSQEKENISQKSISAVTKGIDGSQESVISISSQEEPMPTTPTQGIRLGLSKFAVNNQNKKKPALVTSNSSRQQAPVILARQGCLD